MVDESVSKTENKLGSQNNVIAIDEADFEVNSSCHFLVFTN